jgi:integrase
VVYRGKPVFHPLKTERALRTVKLSDELVKSLHEHKARQNEEKMRRRVTYKDHGLVFPTQDGLPFDPNRLVKRYFKPLLVKAGLPDFRYHDLGHTAATMMLKDGVPVKVVSEILGHANEVFTMRVYGHVLPRMQEIALALFDKK